MALDLQIAVVGILRENRLVGTGFIVSPDGLIATCAHVAQAEAAGNGRPESVTVRFHHNGEKRLARTREEWWKPAYGKDIALLEVEGGLPAGVQSLLLGESRQREGHPFRAFGYPRLGEIVGVHAAGSIRGPVQDTRGRPLLQLASAGLAPGMSGAPVLDETAGCIVGMVTSGVQPGPEAYLQEAAFATPAETLAALCPRLHLAAPPAEPARPPLPPEERTALERTLAMARRALSILEEQAAAFGPLNIPPYKQIELEDQRKKVAELEKRGRGE